MPIASTLRPLLALTFLGAVLGFAGPVRAGDAPPDGADVKAWLLRIHEAASKRNFQGTFVVSGGGSVSSARIAHYCEGPSQFEKIESLDGQARHVFRHNDVVHTLWPSSRVAVIEQSQLVSSFPALLQGSDSRITDHYDVRSQGVERVAGLEANVLQVRPRDDLRFGFRLWSDRQSGLLLRADVIGGRGEVLETSAFSEVTIGVKPQPEKVLHAMKQLDGYRVVRPLLTPTQLEAEGWSLRQAVPGFREVSCVRRPMESPGAAEGDAAAEPVLQTIFSDGLTHVSVFIERFDERRHVRPLLAAVGATRTLMMRKQDWWVTVVGDVPGQTLKMFADGLERRK